MLLKIKCIFIYTTIYKYKIEQSRGGYLKRLVILPTGKMEGGVTNKHSWPIYMIKPTCIIGNYKMIVTRYLF